MSLVTDEQSEKRAGQFLKLEDKDKLVVLSNLYKVFSHYLKADKKTVICKGEECFYCQTMGESPRTEYFYYGMVNEEEGVVRVPATVFFSMNEQERVLEMDKRDYIWVISKKGSGLQTEYSVARGKEAGVPSVSIEEANKKLTSSGDAYVKSIEKNYNDRIEDVDLDEVPV